MKALVFTALGESEVTEVAKPTPGPGEVLVRVDATGFCHTDLDVLHGRYPASFPRIPCHEYAGTVVEAHDKADEYLIGKLVAIDPLLSCGECRNCLRGFGNLCPTIQAYGSDVDGGAAEYSVVSAHNVHDATGLAPHIAALAEPFACILNGIQRSGIGPEDRVAVVGAGPIGMMMGVLLATLGVTSAAVFDVAEARLSQAHKFGFTETHHVVSDLTTAAGGERYDAVFDATGRPAVVQQCLALLEDAGTLVPFGVCPPGSEVTLDPNEVYARQLRIIGSFSLSGTVPAALELLRETKFDVGALVTDRYDFVDAKQAFERIGSPESLKIQVSPA
ncbi:MAG: alcohol dehydrogenase catalytic domain-containing protein [Leucobacter sp.]